MPNNILFKRFLLKISQQDLARRLSVSQPTVYKWEKGYSEPSPEMKTRIAAALESPVEEIFGMPAPETCQRFGIQ